MTSGRGRARWSGGIALLLAGVIAYAQGLPSDTAPAEVIAQERESDSVGRAAKLLASAVFISGRNPQQALVEDVYPPEQAHERAKTRIDVDRKRNRVTMSTPTSGERTAVFTGENAQGVVLLPTGESQLRFTPRAIPRQLPPADSAWPWGDRLDASARPRGIDDPALLAAVASAFEGSDEVREQQTRALVVLYKGQIVGERYAPGFHQGQPLIGWSMGKTIAAALFGIVARWEPQLSVQSPAPIPQWQQPNDPRAQITIANLLHMSGGLSCPYPRPADANYATSRHVHNSVYRGIVDAHAAMLERPLEKPPGSAWAYRNTNTFALAEIVRARVQARGLDYLAFPQQALFDRIGARSFVLETDLVGNFLITGYDYGSARDWARFGEFLRRDGVAFDGTRLLPEGYVDFLRTPAPAAPDSRYGGQVWLNAGGAFPAVPRDAYYARGLLEQIVLVIPSREAVVVRMGHSPGVDGPKLFNPYFSRVVDDILRALPAAQSR
jgi:CubicO group peptidase (beta-lactamase class C family)